MALSRRTVLGGGVLLGGATALDMVGLLPSRPSAAGTGPEVEHGTNVAVSYHSASRQLTFDIANVLWLLPLGGGRATRLTEDLEDVTWPSFFPDGQRVACQSFREGTYDICAVSTTDGRVERLTSGPQYDLDPAVSPDGEHIAYVSDAGGTSAVWLLTVATGETRELAGSKDTRAYRSPTWHPDGTKLACVAGAQVLSVNVATGACAVLHTSSEGGAYFGTSYGPGGHLTYVEVLGHTTRLLRDGSVLSDEAEEPAPFPAAWISESEIVHEAAGELRRRRLDDFGAFRTIPFKATLTPPGDAPEIRQPVTLPKSATVRGIASPMLSPDGESVCFRALGAIWSWRVGSAATKLVHDAYFNADPSWSPDSREIIYSSDRSGVPNLWKHTLSSGQDEQLTDRADGAFLPTVAPSGQHVAFQDEAGATYVLDLGTGRERQVAEASFHPGRPSWSPDSRHLAMAVTVPASERDNAGLNEILTVDTTTEESRTQTVAPHRSLATRGDDGPVWSPDGKYFVAVIDSLLHRIPIEPDGQIAGEPTVLSDLVADAVSVSGSGQVLFLSLGDFVLTPLRQEAATRRLPAPLECKEREAAPRMLLRAGQLWDGTSNGYRRQVDITVEDGLITSVEPVRANSPTPTVDASDRTVIPGLIDVHNHWHFRGRQWAGRQGPLWLSYGVTTSRSTGDPVYQMIETREAIHAGASPGPRFLGSGEALDGTRCYYHFTRCVNSKEQLDLELQRVTELGYHLVKSYQRLPVQLERRLVSRLKAAGIPAVSHYLFPALATGFNGMEHTGGGNRLGYSRTLSFAGGRTSEDTVKLLSESGMWVSSTLLFANEMFVDSPDLVEDRRTRVLFPAWDYERLHQKVEQAHGEENGLNEAWTKGDVDLLLRVHQAGGTVVAGTDAPLDDIGIGIHQNLRAMVKHGFSPVDALRTATRNAALSLGAADELGVIRPGARADMLVIDGDPLLDIVDTAKIDQVFVDGHGRKPSELLAPYEGKQQAERGGADGPRGSAHVTRRPNRHELYGCCRPRPGKKAAAKAV